MEARDLTPVTDDYRRGPGPQALLNDSNDNLRLSNLAADRTEALEVGHAGPDQVGLDEHRLAGIDNSLDAAQRVECVAGHLGEVPSENRRDAGRLRGRAFGWEWNLNRL